MTADDFAALRDAGLGDAAILHVLSLAAFFNYLNRVADAIDIEFDYESPLPRMKKDPARVPVTRPARADWPRPDRAPPLALRLADRPFTSVPFYAWREYMLERDAPLSRRERRVLARAAATELCDARTVEHWPDAEPTNDRELALAEYAATLTSAPWQLTAAHLDRLRALHLDDEALLDVITVAAFQSTASRLALVLSEV